MSPWVVPIAASIREVRVVAVGTAELPEMFASTSRFAIALNPPSPANWVQSASVPAGAAVFAIHNPLTPSEPVVFKQYTAMPCR